MAPAELEQALKPIRQIFNIAEFPDLLVGLDIADDAAVYRISDQQAIVSTVDFFPPVVDDPYDFGAIAAANALSDIYAMGGSVLFAINLVAFPDNLNPQILQDILRGGAAKVAEAGAVVAGGHSITDKEPKYGLAVTGIVDPRKVKTKGGAKPGDALLLTKPLGSGVITTALKRQIALPEHVAAAVRSMKVLNKVAAETAQTAGAHAITDVTGFGLLGHGREMAEKSQVDFRIFFDQLPWLPGAFDYAEEQAFPGGTENNRQFFFRHIRFEGINNMGQDLLYTPETSGGLLVAVRRDAVRDFLGACESAVEIGVVTAGNGRINVFSSRKE